MADEPKSASASVPRPKRCAICGKPANADTRPFCSARCKNIDLNRWFSGAYAIPATEADDEDDAPSRDDSGSD